MRQLDSKIDSILKFTAENAEFVVEEGTFDHLLWDSSDYWTSGKYIKYSSGRVEVFANRRIASVTPDGAMSTGGYYKILKFALPDVLKEIQLVTSEIEWSAGLFWSSTRYIELNKPKVAINCFSNNGGANALVARIYAVGRYIGGGTT